MRVYSLIGYECIVFSKAVMNDYVQGAVEALAWFSMLLERGIALNWDARRVKEEVDLMSEVFQSQIAESFHLH